MAVERVIGIDFGTSTSVIKVKTYNDAGSVEAREMSDYVRFDNKSTVPTLVYTTADGRQLAGYEAEHATAKGMLHQNFKLNLIDPEKKEEAIACTATFLKYLFTTYSEQRNYFPSCDTEITYIAYPAKWPQDVRETMIGLVEKAGFKNVRGIDEPSAAIHAVMVQERARFEFAGDRAANILVVDMGAGTTDLVLCQYSPLWKEKLNVLNVWPKADSAVFFGGREIDEALCEYVKAYLVNCGAPNVRNFREKNLEKCKAWKENNVSSELREKRVVRYCGFADSMLSMLDVDADMEFPPISRESFEDMFSDYLAQYAAMINDCLDDAGFDRADVDYVILTGGHSQWYFAHEVVTGALTKFGWVDLPKIKEDNARVIKMEWPQETVALGLVYQRIDAAGEAAEGSGSVYCRYCGTPRPTDEAKCPYCAGQTGGGQKLPAVPASAAPSISATPNVYALPVGKTVRGASQAVESLLGVSKNMDTQSVCDGERYMVQARVKGGKWKQFLGLDVAVTVQLEPQGSGEMAVRIGQAKWVDKVAALGGGILLLEILPITILIGTYMQAKLPGDIRNAISRYLLS